MNKIAAGANMVIEFKAAYAPPKDYLHRMLMHLGMKPAKQVVKESEELLEILDEVECPEDDAELEIFIMNLEDQGITEQFYDAFLETCREADR
jgi:hypothetical protein